MVKSMKEKSQAVIQAELHLKEIKRRERNAVRVKSAQEYLSQYEGEYNRAKTIFFGVNGARRVLKSA